MIWRPSGIAVQRSGSKFSFPSEIVLIAIDNVFERKYAPIDLVVVVSSREFSVSAEMYSG